MSARPTSVAIADIAHIPIKTPHSKTGSDENDIAWNEANHTLKTHSNAEWEEKIMADDGQRYFGLKWAIALAFIAKFAIFLISVAIIGLASTRTELSACGSSVPGPAVYSSPFGDLEAYTDYRDLYLKCLVNPFLAGKSAYNLPIVYNYPPLFIYTLAIFALETAIWFPAISLVFFDALTVIPLYLIAKDFLFSGNRKLAFTVALIWIFNPINLFYNDLMWLNPAPTTFFTMLGIYLMLKKEWGFSAVSLAISTGFKQTAVLLFPILLIWMLKTLGSSRKVLAYTALYVSILVLISAPYIFQNPQQYFWALNFPILGNPPGAGPSAPSTFVYDLSQPTRLTTFLGLVRFVDLKSFAVATYSYLNYAFAASYVFLMLQFGIGVRNSGMLFADYFRTALQVLKWFARRVVLRRNFNTSLRNFLASAERLPKVSGGVSLEGNTLLVYCFVAILLFLTLFGRGVYKYYFAGLTPLAVPLFSSKKGAIIFEIFSMVLLVIPREVTPLMALLLITMVPRLLNRVPNQIA
ncbi:MAG: hypothetical protein ACREBS_04365 [Nitrososphaerales archaeon]